MKARFSSKLGAVLSLVSVLQMTHAQTQIGNDIDGEAANNWSGKSISMPNETTIAIGAQSNDDVASGAGHVRIFEWNNSAWVQKGNDIDGRSAFDAAGTIVSMPDANTVAFGVPGNAQSTNPFGRVEIHTWNGSSWVQKGTDINGISPGERFGYSVSMPDPNTIAIGSNGAPTWTTNPAGQVYVYEWSGTDWVQKGATILGQNSGDQFGYYVTMPDENTVAASAPFNDNAFNDAGQTRIYQWDGSNWTQKGTDLLGEASGDNSGWSICMPDNSTIAIGAPKNAGGGFWNGHTRIYSWDGSSWLQKGTDIDGSAIGDLSGSALSMPESNTIAIGAPGHNGGVPLQGQVRVFSWNGASWNQTGSDIIGEAQDDESGSAVAMPSSSIVAVGAYENEGNGNAAGHVRIYSMDGQVGLTDARTMGNSVKIGPNPAGDFLHIELAEREDQLAISILSLDGKHVWTQHLMNVNEADVRFECTPGIYLVQVSTQHETLLTSRIIKN